MPHAWMKIIWLLTLVVACGQMVLWWPELPDVLATKFDFQGQARGQTPKSTYYCVHIAASFIVVLPLVGSVLRYLPNGLINIPNKKYWLSPERRDQTLRDSARSFGVISILSVWMLIGLFHLIAEVATQRRAGIAPASTIFMAIYLGAIAVLCIQMLRKYRVLA